VFSGIIRVFTLCSTSNGTTSIYLTQYRYLNRALEHRFDEGAQTAYDYLIYHRWYRYQLVYPVIASCEYRFPIIRELRYRFAAFYRRYGA
jgi:hypothetical protein